MWLHGMISDSAYRFSTRSNCSLSQLHEELRRDNYLSMFHNEKKGFSPECSLFEKKFVEEKADQMASTSDILIDTCPRSTAATFHLLSRKVTSLAQGFIFHNLK